MRPALIALLALLSFCGAAHGIDFPYAAYGDCYDGCLALAKEYPGQDVDFAYYEPTERRPPGHVALLVDGKLIDSFLGPLKMDVLGKPDKIFQSMEALNEHITIRID